MKLIIIIITLLAGIQFGFAQSCSLYMDCMSCSNHLECRKTQPNSSSFFLFTFTQNFRMVPIWLFLLQLHRFHLTLCFTNYFSTRLSIFHLYRWGGVPNLYLNGLLRFEKNKKIRENWQEKKKGGVQQPLLASLEMIPSSRRLPYAHLQTGTTVMGIALPLAHPMLEL